MSVINYTKQNFVDGNVLHASELNNIDTGVYNNSNIVSNPNLLRNPFFSVNSRNFTTITGSGASRSYTVDGWIAFGYQLATWRRLSGGALVVSGGGAAGDSGYVQIVNGLEAGTYTFSAKITTGTPDGSNRWGYLQVSKGYPTTQASIISSYITRDGIISITFTIENKGDYDNFRVLATSGGSITFTAAKLERGEISTLANDVLRVVPDRAQTFYELERFKCLTNTDDVSDTYANMGIGVVRSYSVTLLSTGWTSSSESTFTQDIAVEGLLSTDNIIVDIELSSSQTVAQQLSIINDWNPVRIWTPSSGSIRVRMSAEPSVNIPIKILCIRK